jgi:hypothetical protein
MQVKVPTKDLRDYLRYLIQIRIVFEAREDRQAYDVTFGQTLCWSRPWYACNRGTSGWAHPRSDGRAPPPLLRATPQRSMPTSISTSPPPSAPLVSAAKDAPWDQIALHVRCFGRPSLLPCLWESSRESQPKRQPPARRLAAFESSPRKSGLQKSRRKKRKA